VTRRRRSADTSMASPVRLCQSQSGLRVVNLLLKHLTSTASRPALAASSTRSRRSLDAALSPTQQTARSRLHVSTVRSRPRPRAPTCSRQNTGQWFSLDDPISKASRLPPMLPQVPAANTISLQLRSRQPILRAARLCGSDLPRLHDAVLLRDQDYLCLLLFDLCGERRQHHAHFCHRHPLHDQQ